jgi:V8-like Glu-specific endopeptidase
MDGRNTARHALLARLILSATILQTIVLLAGCDHVADRYPTPPAVAALDQNLVGDVSVTYDYPWAAGLGSGGGAYDLGCMGTLITPLDVLTAGHCATDLGSSLRWVRFLSWAGSVQVASVDVYPQDAQPPRDLAVVHLREAVTIPNPGNDPRLNGFPALGNSVKPVGTFFTITGYMNNGVRAIRLYKTMGTIAVVQNDQPVFLPVLQAVYYYSNRVTEGGDSGSALFVIRATCSLDGGDPSPCDPPTPEIIGVHISGYNNGAATRTDVPAARAWVLAHLQG